MVPHSPLPSREASVGRENLAGRESPVIPAPKFPLGLDAMACRGRVRVRPSRIPDAKSCCDTSWNVHVGFGRRSMPSRIDHGPGRRTPCSWWLISWGPLSDARGSSAWGWSGDRCARFWLAELPAARGLPGGEGSRRLEGRRAGDSGSVVGSVDPTLRTASQTWTAFGAGVSSRRGTGASRPSRTDASGVILLRAVWRTRGGVSVRVGPGVPQRIVCRGTWMPAVGMLPGCPTFDARAGIALAHVLWWWTRGVLSDQPACFRCVMILLSFPPPPVVKHAPRRSLCVRVVWSFGVRFRGSGPYPDLGLASPGRAARRGAFPRSSSRSS